MSTYKEFKAKLEAMTIEELRRERAGANSALIEGEARDFLLGVVTNERVQWALMVKRELDDRLDTLVYDPAVTYHKLSVLVDAVKTGKVNPACLIVRVDNDHVSADLLDVPKDEATEEDWDNAREVWKSKYGPEHTLIELLNDLGVPAESV